MGRPNTISKAAWHTWRTFLKASILTRGMPIKQDLGNRIRQDLDLWRWYFSPSLNGLISYSSDNDIHLHSREQSHSKKYLLRQRNSDF
jgi:hypothetical protein